MSKNPHAQALGKLGGSSKSAKKIAAVRKNAALGRKVIEEQRKKASPSA